MLNPSDHAFEPRISLILGEHCVSLARRWHRVFWPYSQSLIIVNLQINTE